MRQGNASGAKELTSGVPGVACDSALRLLICCLMLLSRCPLPNHCGHSREWLGRPLGGESFTSTDDGTFPFNWPARGTQRTGHKQRIGCPRRRPGLK